MHTSIRISAALVAALSVAGSQEPVRPVPSAAQVLRTPTPIHMQADDPIGGAYGVWTAGPTWKASFHDGFRFYAYATDLHEHPRLGWNTESVAIGGETLSLGKSRSSWTADQHVTEYASLSFRLGGDERIRYGEALAFDAAGNRAPVATSFDGERIRLHVPADFVASAAFPLTIDPLTSAISVVGSNSAVTDVTWTGTTASGSNLAINAWVVQTSATDQDMWASACREDGTGSPLIFQDVKNSWSTRTVDSTEVATPNRWLLAFERFFPSSSMTASRVQVITIGVTPAAGTTLFGTTGTRAPRIGGRRNGTSALVVSGTATGMELQIVDAAAASLGATRALNFTADRWSVSRSASGASSWCVLRTDDAVGTSAFHVATSLSVDATGVIGAPAGAGDPQVDGDIATWTDFDALLARRRVRAQRIDITTGAVTPGTVRTVSNVGLFTSLANGEVSYDYSTQSHWAVTWMTNTASTPLRTARVARLGYQGGVVESQELFSTGSSVGVLDPFVGFNGSFPSGVRPTFSAGYVAYSPSAAGHLLYHRTFQHAPDAIASTYGSSCSNAVIGDGHPPFAGSQFYNVSAQGLPANSVAWVSIGVGPTNLPLDVIGMTGCVMLTDPIITLSTPTNGSGLAILYIPLNDAPVFLGDFYLQWLWLNAAANTLGVVNSRGMHVQVR